MKKLTSNTFWRLLSGIMFILFSVSGGCSKSQATKKNAEKITESPPYQDASTHDTPSREKLAEQPPEPIDTRPPKICKKPTPLGNGPYFKDISEQMGLGLKGKLQAFGNRIASVDLDQDGYPDLIIHAVNAKRDDWNTSPPRRYRWILYNRPDPNNPKRRIFVDKTKESGYLQTRDPKIIGRQSHFAVFADVNNDGHIDIFSGVQSDPNKPSLDTKDRNRILLNDGKGHFAFAPTSAITPTPQQLWTTTSATFLDYDKDGIIDIFVGFWYAHYGRSYEAFQDRLYKGKGDGTFVDVTNTTGLKTLSFSLGYKRGKNHRPTYGVTSCDVNGDGHTDIIVSAYGRQFNMLYLNDGHGHFQDVAQKVGFAGDNNHDISDNEFYRCYCAASIFNCPKNVPKPRIRCPSRSPWHPGFDDHPFRLNGNTFTTVCGDINNDGKMDLYNTEIRHWHIGQSSDPTQLILNISQGKTFALKRLSPKETGMERPKVGGWNQGDIYAAFLDFDNDTKPDIYLCSSDYPNTHGHLFRQINSASQMTPKFQDISTIAGIAHPRAAGLAVVDIDNDGDLDLIIGSSRMRCRASEGCPWKKPEIHVYENLVGQNANWLKVQLIGKGKNFSNTMAIGAKITVIVGKISQTREITGGYGHFGMQNDFTAHFGLGSHCEIDTLIVQWPNKNHSTQTFHNIRANYKILIKEGNPKIQYITQ